MFDLEAVFSWIKKTFRKRDLLILSLLVAAFFLTRLVNLDQFPIFTDEGIYIRWAKVARADASWRFISLTDGKQPLHIWGMIPFLKLFPDNALLAGRLFSVASGFTALTGIFLLLLYLFGKTAAYWGAILYISNPYFLFYDRLALADSGVTAGFVWILFFSILTARTLRLDTAMAFGLIGGFSLLMKSSTQMFMGLSLFAPVLVAEKKLARFFKKLVNFYALYLAGAIIAALMYNIQRLSPFLHYVAEKNKTFVLTFDEFLANPFTLLLHNLKTIPLYVYWESAWVLPFIALLGYIALYKKDRRLFFYLFIWLIVPYIAIAFFAKVLFPRYLIFFAVLYVVTASYYLASLKKRAVLVTLLLLYFASVLYFDYPILFKPENMSLPPVDRGQYIEGTSAGYGVREIVHFAREKSAKKPVILIAEGNFGVVGDMLESSLRLNDKISIRGYWPLDKPQLLENQTELKNSRVFVVFSHRTEFPRDWPVRFVQKFEKPGGKSAFYLFELVQ